MSQRFGRMVITATIRLKARMMCITPPTGLEAWMLRLVRREEEKKIKDCYYNHEVRERKDKVSDHSMMVLELG